jgi:hypothetical protein
LLNDLRRYWPFVLAASVPVIPVYEEGYVPSSFPVFVRGRASSFGAKSKIDSAAEFWEFEAARKSSGLVVRPFMEIERCGRRSKVTKELRAHIVCGRCKCVEFLFPRWAAVKPSEEEFAEGCRWTSSLAAQAANWSEAIAQRLLCSWFVADFAQTVEGPRLIELNPGWCAGVTDPASSRSLHLGILAGRFRVPVRPGFWPKPTPNVPFIQGP